MEPPAHLFDLAGEEIAGPRDKTAGTEFLPRAVQIAGVAEEPQPAARGEPAVAVVLRVAVGGDDAIAVREGLVDFGEVVLRDEIVGVEDEIGVVMPLPVVAVDRREKKVEDVALAEVLGVPSLIDDGAVRRADAGGIVGTVVRSDKNIEQLARVVLRVQTVDEIPDDARLVARRDQNGKAVGDGFGFMRGVFFEKSDEYIEELVEITKGEQTRNREIEDHQKGMRLHGKSSLGKEFSSIVADKREKRKGKAREFIIFHVWKGLSLRFCTPDF